MAARSWVAAALVLGSATAAVLACSDDYASSGAPLDGGGGTSGGWTSSGGTSGAETSLGGTSGGGGADAGASDGGDGGDGGNAGECRVPLWPTPQQNTSGGPSGCRAPGDCTVRFTGNFCCPRDPQAMTQAAAGSFDESRNGAGTAACREACQTVRCAPLPDAAATCTNEACVLR